MEKSPTHDPKVNIQLLSSRLSKKDEIWKLRYDLLYPAFMAYGECHGFDFRKMQTHLKFCGFGNFNHGMDYSVGPLKVSCTF